MNRFSLVGILMIISLTASAQSSSYKGIPSLVWAKLYDISYETASDQYGEYMVPKFSDETKKMDGQVVTLPGYMIPFETGFNEKHFILSSLPLNACFFCGVGGPESVIEVYSSKEVKYTDKPIEIKGKLTLNAKDPDQFMYILVDSEYLGELEF